jgi:ATP/maltotriose-dependent transcriptional regulator MalT
MDLDQRTTSVKFLIRDRAGPFTGSFDAVFTAAAIRILTSPSQAPRANAICERMIGTLRREVFDRLLIVNEHHLRRVLTEYLRHYNTARPHRSLGQLAPAQARARRSESTSPSTGTAENRSSADSPTSTRSPPDSPTLLQEEGRSLPRSCIRAQQAALLHACGQAGAAPPSRRAAAGLPGMAEPLTDREMEVLRLLAAGRSNQRIAHELVAALDTVKKHVTHLLGKLGAANRTEAGARARQLGLIP